MGEVVECPQCSTRLEVPPADGGAVSASAPPAAGAVEEEDEFELRLAPPEERRLLEFSLDEVAHQGPSPADAVSPQPTAGDESKCPECGERLGADGMLCTACGYHLILKRKVNADLSDLEENEKVGFDRWLADQLEAGESIETVLFWLDLVVGGVLILMALVGGLFGKLLALLLGGGYIFWRIVNRRKRQQEGQVMGLRGPHWRVALRILRLAQWRTLSHPARPLHCLNLRESNRADDALAEADLGGVEVIDCDESSLTDVGLLAVENALELKFLIVCNTQVTREALCRLQERRRDCWIWY